MRHITTLSLLAALAIAGCKTTPEPVAPEVVIIPPPVQTCAPVSALQQVIIPAETKVQYTSTGVDGSEGATIKRIIVTKPAEIIYVDSDGRQVLDICERDSIEIGATGPGVGEVIPGG